MARYSSALAPYSTYSSGSYGNGDVPDLRLKYLVALPTDRSRSHIDADGLAVYGRVTLFWAAYGDGLETKVLRSAHGPALSHNDPAAAVIAASRSAFSVISALRHDDGFTVVSVDVPHMLRAGDEVTISGTGVADGTFHVSTVLNPAQFAVSLGPTTEATSTTGTVEFSDARDVLPQYGPGERSYTDLTVVPGAEYHYSVFLKDPTPGVNEWHYGGSASIRAPKDLGSFQRLLEVLPPYLTNNQFDLGGRATVDTLRDTDYDLRPTSGPTMTKVLAGVGWVWDDLRSDLAGASRLWEPTLVPSAALPHALATLGVDTRPSLSDKALRSLMANASVINELRGAPQGLVALSECVTGMSAEVGRGYNIMPSVDDAEFHGGTGHWVASPASVDGSTESGRDLRAEESDPAIESSAEEVAATAYISPEGPATGDSPTAATRCLAFGGYADPEVHIGFCAAVRRVSPTVPAPNRTYLVETHFPHGLERGDVVTTAANFPVPADTGLSFTVDGHPPPLIVVDTPSATEVSLRVKDSESAPSTAAHVAELFGSGDWKALSLAERKKNPFAVANGLAVEEQSVYTLSFEGTVSGVPSDSGDVAPTIEVYYYDEHGYSAGKYALGTLSTYDSSGTYDSTSIVYDASAALSYSVGQWTKTVLPISTPRRAKYAAIRIRMTGTSDASLTYRLRRLMLVRGGVEYRYQPPRLVSVDLSSQGSTSTWGAPRTNLVTDPSIEGGDPFSGSLVGSYNTSTYRTGTRSYAVTVGSSPTGNHLLGYEQVHLPTTGTYTASAYFRASNSTAADTAVRLIPDVYDGSRKSYPNYYSSYDYPVTTTTGAVVAPAISPATFFGGTDPVTSSAQWLVGSKDQWYDEQVALEVVLADAEDRSAVVGNRFGVRFPRTAQDGDAGRVLVSPGTSYRAGAWVRSPSASVPVEASILWHDVTGKVLAESRGDLSLLLPTTNRRDYSWLSVTDVAPAVTRTATAQITSATSSGTTRTLSTAEVHEFRIGDLVTVSVGSAAYDGTYAVTAATATSFSYTGPTSTSTSASLPSNPVASVVRPVTSATLAVSVPSMTETLCGRTLYVTCPTMTLSAAPEVVAFRSSGALTQNGWSRASVTWVAGNAAELTAQITALTQGEISVAGAGYLTDSWLVESGSALLPYFDGSAAFQTAPHFAGWTGTANGSTSMTGRSLPGNAVEENSDSGAAVAHLRSQLPDNVALGSPYRVTVNGLVDRSPVRDLDPTFSRTYTSSVH